MQEYSNQAFFSPPGTKIQGNFPPVIFNLRIWRLSDLEMTVGVDSKSDTKSLSSVLETSLSLTDAIFLHSNAFNAVFVKLLSNPVICHNPQSHQSSTFCLTLLRFSLKWLISDTYLRREIKLCGEMHQNVNEKPQ